MSDTSPILRRKHVPTHLKGELGVTQEMSSDITLNGLIEADPMVSTLLSEMEAEADGIEPVLIKDPNQRGRTIGGTKDAVDKRNEAIVSLYGMGLSTATVQRHINAKAKLEGWPEIAHERSIKRIISQYYASQRPSVKDEKNYLDGLREATFAAQEKLIERLAIYISKRPENSWKPFEYQATLDTLYRMRQQLVDNRNWNYSRMNPLISVNQQNNQLNVFSDNSAAVINEKPKALQEILDYLEAEIED